MPRFSQVGPSQLIALSLALGIGLLIGLERERRKGAGPDRRRHRDPQLRTRCSQRCVRAVAARAWTGGRRRRICQNIQDTLVFLFNDTFSLFLLSLPSFAKLLHKHRFLCSSLNLIIFFT